MSAEHLARAFPVRGVAPTAKLALILVAASSDMDGRVWEPFNRIADQACCNEADLFKLFGELEAAGLIVRERTRHLSSGVVATAVRLSWVVPNGG